MIVILCESLPGVTFLWNNIPTQTSTVLLPQKKDWPLPTAQTIINVRNNGPFHIKLCEIRMPLFLFTTKKSVFL